MKQLQCNFTNPEQSRRLLELGVPADSADFFWFDERDIFFLKDKLYSDEAKDDEFVRATDYAPCWSVGRLIEIILLCPHRRNITISKGYNPIESLINQLVMLREVGTDFSKLEE